ncbi:radical SAM family heme chaperone HemW [Buchnera aphidicola]|uniref:radical SAM family heme chaperone HemW n=1 Tax=Buchnera aphidicola TaxID=9 RepID=UPI003BEF4052
MYKFNPMSIYVHIPWCLKKCEYCDFNTYIQKNNIPEEMYIKHLLQDLENDIKFIHDRKINTIFIGGGTPSLFKNESIHKLIKGIKKRINISYPLEISIEVNPNTVELKDFIYYKHSGINRISLGIQSLNSKHLINIGRTYTNKEAINTITIAKKIFKNTNIDIMYGLPKQSVKEALLDLQNIINYQPSHISWYQLMIEPNTVFYAKKINTPDENIILTILKKGEKLLIQSGYKKYEISSYSQSNFLCKHNLNYWNFGDYIGIGCGAHGKITQKNGKIIRIVKNKNPYDFLSGNYLNSIKKINDKDIVLEYFMNTFRLYNPIFKKHFQEKTFIKSENIEKYIDIAIQNGYLINNPKYWKTTQKGKMFLNSLLEIFLH